MLIDKPLNRQCDLVFRWPTLRSKLWVSEFLNSAEDDKNILSIIAVGSAVRPSVPSVDVDLIVISLQPSLVNRNPPIEVDLRAYSSLDVNRKIEDRHDMLIWTVRFGIVLYQRDFFWDRIVNSWRNRLPLPSVELAFTRARASYRRLSKMKHLGDEDAMMEQSLALFTHLARIALLQKGIFPASRPELPGQLREIGDADLAEPLNRLYHGKMTKSEIEELLEAYVPSLEKLSIAPLSQGKL